MLKDKKGSDSEYFCTKIATMDSFLLKPRKGKCFQSGKQISGQCVISGGGSFGEPQTIC